MEKVQKILDGGRGDFDYKKGKSHNSCFVNKEFNQYSSKIEITLISTENGLYFCKDKKRTIARTMGRLEEERKIADLCYKYSKLAQKGLRFVEKVIEKLEGSSNFLKPFEENLEFWKLFIEKLKDKP